MKKGILYRPQGNIGVGDIFCEIWGGLPSGKGWTCTSAPARNSQTGWRLQGPATSVWIPPLAAAALRENPEQLLRVLCEQKEREARVFWVEVVTLDGLDKAIKGATEFNAGRPVAWG